MTGIAPRRAGRNRPATTTPSGRADMVGIASPVSRAKPTGHHTIRETPDTAGITFPVSRAKPTGRRRAVQRAVRES